MSQRNPMNDRYMKDEERSGKTRKSAASAKPVAKAAASVRHEDGSSEEPKGMLARARRDANKRNNKRNQKVSENRREQQLRNQYYNVPTAEYKKWRRVWWGLLAAAIALVGVSFALSRAAEDSRAMFYVIGVSYVCIFVAIMLDMTVIRRIRREYQDEMIAQHKSKKNSAVRKEAAAQARQEAKEAEENPPEEERKLFRGLFTKKRAADAVAVAKSAQARAAAQAEDGADAAEAAGAAADAAEDAAAGSK